MWFCHLTSFLSFRVRYNQWQAPLNFVGLIFPKKFFTSRSKIISLLFSTRWYYYHVPVGSWLKKTRTLKALFRLGCWWWPFTHISVLLWSQQLDGRWWHKALFCLLHCLQGLSLSQWRAELLLQLWWKYVINQVRNSS